jgi:hypothetical protein
MVEGSMTLSGKENSDNRMHYTAVEKYNDSGRYVVGLVYEGTSVLLSSGMGKGYGRMCWLLRKEGGNVYGSRIGAMASKRTAEGQGNRGVHRVLVGKPEGKRPLGRPRRRWEDNIKMKSSEIWRGSWGPDGVGSG